MSELYDQIVSQRGSLQRLFARIPGFRGYQDKAERRNADMMLRNHIAGELAKRVNRFASIEKSIIEDGGLSYMGKSRNAKSKLQLYLDRVKAAAPGYSAFNESIKVGTEELEKLYSFDEAQIRYVDKFDEALTTLDQAVKSKEGIDKAISAIDDLAAEANEAFKLREDVLVNLNKSL